MRREVLAVSRAAARKLLWSRTAEAAAVGAAAAGLCSGALQVAWLTAEAALPVSVAICVLVAAAAGGFALPAVRRTLGLPGRQAAFLAGICAAAGAGGAACVLAGWHLHVGQLALPAVLLPGGALVGAAGVLLRGVSAREAAAVLDARLHLAEQLATATELAETPARSDPPARYVCKRALAAVGKSPGARRWIWTRTGATAGTLLLAVLLCATLGFVPPFGRRGDDALAEIAAAVETMPPARRVRLARSFRAAAGDDPKVAALLAAAASAVEDRDAGRLERLLRELRSAGLEPLAVVPAELMPPRGSAGRGVGRTGRGDGSPAAGTAPETVPAPHRVPQFVRVYDPSYAKFLAARGPGASPATGDAHSVRYEDAWQAARRRAAGALDRGEVPHEYRRILQAFFGTR